MASNILDHAKSLAASGDLAVAVEYLDHHADFAEAMKAYEDLVLFMYWEMKNVKAVVIFAELGINRMLQAAGVNGESRPLRDRARILAYNLASFTWPGWDEPGITISDSDQKAGLAAAQLHYELVQSLTPDPQTSGRAAWIVGAQLLTAHDYTAARNKFDESSQHHKSANNQAEQLLSQSFAQLAACLESPDDDAQQSQLIQTKLRLLRAKDGEEFVRQLDTAEAVCRRSRQSALNS